MVDESPDFETKDNDGRTQAYSGTATTSVASVPSSAGEKIAGASIFNNGSVDLLVSFDGGTSFLALGRKSFFSKNIKGQPTQLQVKTNSGTSAYEIAINFEEN